MLWHFLDKPITQIDFSYGFEDITLSFSTSTFLPYDRREKPLFRREEKMLNIIH